MKVAPAVLAIVVAATWNTATVATAEIQESRVAGADGVSLYVRTVGKDGPVVVAPFASLHGTQLDTLGQSHPAAGDPWRAGQHSAGGQP